MGKGPGAEVWKRGVVWKLRVREVRFAELLLSKV